MSALATSSTPLIALDAMVVDTETTALDPAQARIVEIAGIGVSGGRIDATRSFERRVRPGVRIPAGATAVHGVDDAAVAEAPPFAEVWPQVQRFVEGRVMIGHSLGFDLAVLERECARAGLPWTPPRSLCTRLLAEVAAPELAGYSLEQLAAWLAVDVEGRHSAAADAKTAAAVFLALLPKLRACGIRTLAEAERACRSLTAALDEQHRAGWAEPIAAPAALIQERAPERIDTYPFRHRVADVMSTPVRRVDDTVTVGEALRLLMRERVSSLIVAPGGDGAPEAAQCGIVTERDLLRAIAESGAEALARPLGGLASRPLVAIPEDAFVYRAAGRMSALGIRHLAVQDEHGRLRGMLSARDLLRVRAQGAVTLGDEIDRAEDQAGLARAWAKLPQVAASLRGEGLTGREVAAVISRQVAALTRAAAVLAERHQRERGRGGPPCAYAVAVLGSAGRGECLLALDQDNALVFEDGEPDGAADRWFAALGERMAAILHEIGVPYCKGGVMAMNAEWRGSLVTWRARIAEWIRRTRPADLLAVDIFFDLRGVHGRPALANTLWREAFEAMQGEVSFAKLLAEAAGPVEPGLTLFGGIRTEGGRIDLKRTGLFGIVSVARVLAIRHHVVERATSARLTGIAGRRIGAAADLDGLVEAQGVFLDLVLDQQIDDLAHGRPPSNSVAVKRLSAADRRRLRTALAQVRHLDTLTRDLLFNG